MIDKALSKLMNINKAQISKIKNIRGDITTDPTGIKRIIKHIINYFDTMGKIIKKHSLPKLI